MAETSGPWDGSGFAQDEWRKLFSYSQMDGLLREDDEFPDGLVPSLSSSNRDVTFSPGQARIRGNLYESDSDIVINVPAPSGGNQRIDYVVLRYDPSEPTLNDRITMQLVQGQEASDPTAPSLTQEQDGVWEWPRIRIGPYGTGAISGAPWRYMGSTMQPFTFSGSGDPNDRLPGLSTVHDALSIDRDGKIWKYDADADQYERLGDPETGSISMSSGWAAGTGTGNSPRYWVKDGLVHLSGTVDRTGGTFQLPSGPPGSKFTGSLPSEIRPGREMSLLGLGRVARSSDTTSHRQPVGIYYASDNRLGIMDAMDPIISEQWMRSTGTIYLHGISWVIH